MAIQQTNDTDFKSILESKPAVIVKYYADWCGSCKLIAPKYRRISEDARFEGIAFLDVNAEENEQARHAAGVDNLPFFAIFKNGQLIKGKATSKEEGILQLLEELKA